MSVKQSPEHTDRRFFVGVAWVQKTERIMPSTFLESPWQKVAMDLFEWEKLTYIIIVDYYSRFIEIAKLDKATIDAVIQHCKNIYSRHGIPEEVVTIN